MQCSYLELEELAQKMKKICDGNYHLSLTNIPGWHASDHEMKFIKSRSIDLLGVAGKDDQAAPGVMKVDTDIIAGMCWITVSI